MFKKILVPTDGSDLAEKAVAAALDVADRMQGEIVAVSVAEVHADVPTYDGDSLIERYDDKPYDRAQEYVNRVMSRAKDRNIPCEAVVRRSAVPYEEIVDVAKAHHCDAIFMTSHGRRGLSKVFLGSVTQNVLAHTNLPVTVFH